MPDLLVTGGAGFIGANFVRYWRRQHPGDRVTVLDSLTYAASPASIADLEDVDLIVGDICDTSLVTRLLGERDVQILVHFAAESHVDRSITGPDAFVTTNIVGTHSLLKAAKAAWLDQGKPHRFHHVSTDEVYGSLEAEDPPFSESTRYAPNSPYSASKAASDHLVRAYHHTFGLNVTTSNCSNNYGPYQFPEKLIPLFMLNCLHGIPLPVYGDGMNRRDWLHVDDHCLGIELAILRGRAGEVYNIGGGQELPNVTVIQEICGTVDAAFAADPSLASRFPAALPALGRRSIELLAFVADRKGHDRRYAIDETKCRSELGYSPRHNFSDGLAATLSWYLANERWWLPLMNRPVSEL
ncbi:dTDP-glucose 4,6-dehydratase [soil metagenome]